MSLGGAIETRDLVRTYRVGKRETRALRGVDLRIESGEMIGVTGPSGSGKSTLLHVLAGLDRAYSGFVSVAETEISRLGDRALSRFRNDRIGVVFQAFNLLPHLTAIENVLVPTAFAPSSAADRTEQARALLRRVGLADREDSLPSHLSGGQQQRVAIARALIHDAPVLLCDEPTGSLDVESGSAVIDLLHEVNQERGATVVIVSHEAHVIDRTDRVIFLRDGRVEERPGGSPADSSTGEST